MRFRTDDRAVTVQIGTVLLFGVLIVLLSTYQATVVPQQNEEVEFNHNQQVQGELQDLRDELLRTAATDSGGSASVALGTRYPERALFVNPAPPSGTLRTTPPSNATVGNATAVGETGDYWNGSDRNFSTRGVTYAPVYHEYRRAPTTVYENGALYNRFESANRTLAGQRLVRGNRISLVALNGSLAESGSATESVDVRPVSAATRTVTVENESADENVTVVVPTNRGAEEWTDLLAEELDEDEDDPERRVTAVEDATTTDGANAVRLVLEPGTYELELAKVGVGSDVSGVDAHYVTTVRGDSETVRAGGEQRVVVEVRDRYNNPVSGARVNVSDPDDPVTPERTETDAEGRATFVYRAPDDPGPKTVAFNISDDPEPREEATVDLFVDGDDGDGDDGADRTYDVEWTDAVGDGLDCDDGHDRCTLDADEGTTVDLTANVTEDGDPVSNSTVDYALNRSDFGDLSPTEGVTDAGENGTTLDVPAENGTVKAYAASGDDVDPITIHVERSGGGPSEQGLRPVESAGVTSGTQLTFTVENTGSESVTVTDFAVDAGGVDASRLNNGDSDELGILRATQPGFANRDGPGNSPTSRFDADGTTYALAAEGSEAVLEPSDDDVTVDFRGFDADLGDLEFADSAADADVTVTLTLDDGTERAIHFRQS
ncbi:Ig-like domain-containing protein [Halorussus salilacus]|uniref:Ig-like domain-containing protein n=1 Tax=Halorussus salilacus TaxID=2953750 RepID=UPI00209F7527|nr:Ig-like domain-containing protein [Halorussus salilacus]USZ67707.1 Ig-like domain-containing protein [Halorussus salilacus]